VWRRTPLGRLLAINLAIGVALAVLLVAGLLVLNPGGLRDLILADRSPLVPIGLLLGGFVVTLGSTAMGTAIMAMGVEQDDGPRRGLRVVKQRVETRR
jgi:acyl-coenzyme A thioesterase PaaI-like protein